MFICPQPYKWNEIHQRLQEAWRELGRKGSPPPTPLILGGWIYSGDEDKKRTWEATVAWAERRGLAHLIPMLSDREKHFGGGSSGSGYAPTWGTET